MVIEPYNVLKIKGMDTGHQEIFLSSAPRQTVPWCRLLKRGACPDWGLLHFKAAAYIEGYVRPA